MDQPNIRAVEAVPGTFCLRLTRQDGTSDTVDLAEPIARLRVLAPLRDPALFAQVAVAEYGWSVTWGDDLDYAADRLWQHARGRHV